MQNNKKTRELILNLGMLLGLILVNLPISQAQQVDLSLSQVAMTSSYDTYQIIDNTRVHPGLGLRYSVQQEWFLFGETHHATDVPLSQEPRLFDPDEPRTIFIGGGIYF